MRAEQQPAKFTVIELATGADLGTYENEAEVAACLSFSRLSADDVEIAADMPAMARYASWSWRSMGPLAAGVLPVGAGARPAPGSGITRESRATDRLPRIRRVRAAEDVGEAIRCSGPTECRRTIYDRPGSTMILPRPRLMM